MKSSLRDNFCSSPWFHLRISPEGNYRPCRWGDYSIGSQHTVANTSLREYLNSDIMSGIRSTLLQGDMPSLCVNCNYESAHGKLSGQQRQLLKSGIIQDNFDKTFCSSPHWDNFQYSYDNSGATSTYPVDLQIDLGNSCNSACIMCSPRYSSRVSEEYKKLHKIDPILFIDPIKNSNWTDNEELVTKFVSDLTATPNIKYIHFLGGETLHMKSFYDICNRLIDNGLAKNIIMGTTTNCTVYDERIEYIIKNFKQVHLGLSIESITPLNNYIRWPSEITSCLEIINKFLDLRNSSNLQISLRVTPNIFSIWHLDSMIEFMITNHVIAESCNILYEPSCLRMELLPIDIKEKTIKKLDQLIDQYKLTAPDDVIINRRREDLIDPVISSIVFEYRDFLLNYTPPQNIEQERYDLIKFIKAYESLHNNCILDYLPEYEEFLRSYGY
jgi:MoaA/NifB/PqqE/SkfB family radical SAM enzyme